MVATTGYSTRLCFDFWQIRQVNLFKILRADFGWRSGISSHVKIVSWLGGVAVWWVCEVVRLGELVDWVGGWGGVGE